MATRKADYRRDDDRETAKTALDYNAVFDASPVGLEYYDKDGILVDMKARCRFMAVGTRSIY